MTGVKKETNETGFTLIELMIVVVIIGVLAAIAYPSYRNYSLKGKRTEAIAAMTDIAGAQEKFYAENLRYAGTISSLQGYSADPFLTQTGLYSITTSGGNTYTLRADAQGNQTQDTACLTLRLFSTGNKTPADCW
jgi:type IV pilus assembly protein PilE